MPGGHEALVDLHTLPGSARPVPKQQVVRLRSATRSSQAARPRPEKNQNVLDPDPEGHRHPEASPAEETPEADLVATAQVHAMLATADQLAETGQAQRSLIRTPEKRLRYPHQLTTADHATRVNMR